MSADYIAYRDSQWFCVTDSNGLIILQVKSPLPDSAAETMVVPITEERYRELCSARATYVDMHLAFVVATREQKAAALYRAITTNDTSLLGATTIDKPKEYPPLNAAKKRLEGIIDSIFEKSPAAPT